MRLEWLPPKVAGLQAVDEINGSPLDAVGPRLWCASAKIAPEKTRDCGRKNMKSNQTVSMTTIATFLALAFPLGLPAQQIQHQNNKHHHYQFIDLGTFGGPTSVNPGIYPALNNIGTVIGIACSSGFAL